MNLHTLTHFLFRHIHEHTHTHFSGWESPAGGFSFSLVKRTFDFEVSEGKSNGSYARELFYISCGKRSHVCDHAWQARVTAGRCPRLAVQSFKEQCGAKTQSSETAVENKYVFRISTEHFLHVWLIVCRYISNVHAFRWVQSSVVSIFSIKKRQWRRKDQASPPMLAAQYRGSGALG